MSPLPTVVLCQRYLGTTFGKDRSIVKSGPLAILYPIKHMHNLALHHFQTHKTNINLDEGMCLHDICPRLNPYKNEIKSIKNMLN